jgi:soluble lytic murein transglycosylase-like protein
MSENIFKTLSSSAFFLIISLALFSGYLDYKKSNSSNFGDYLHNQLHPVQSKEVQIARYIQNANHHLTSETINQLTSLVMEQSEKQDIPAGLILGLIKEESGFKQYAKSNAGALGYWQVMEDVHQDKIIRFKKENVIFTTNIYDIKTNFVVGAKILRDCLDRNDTTEMALQCYNGNKKDKTQRYANKVLNSTPEIV